MIDMFYEPRYGQCPDCREYYEGENHHCDPDKLNPAGREGGSELGQEEQPAYGIRLYDGFRMLDGEPF